MKKIVFVYGLIAGLTSAFWGLFGENFMSDGISLNTRIFFGYASMVLAFSMIFVGIKNYRDHYNNGTISFGKALQVALLITFIASTVYTVAWMIDFYFFLPDFGEKYMASVRAELVAKGTSDTQIQKQMAEMAQYMQQYKNPLTNAITTYKEIVPVGIVISLIAALILKNNHKPASEHNEALKIN